MYPDIMPKYLMNLSTGLRGVSSWNGLASIARPSRMKYAGTSATAAEVPASGSGRTKPGQLLLPRSPAPAAVRPGLVQGSHPPAQYVQHREHPPEHAYSGISRLLLNPRSR
jgi:hypothetical protein